MKVIIATSTSPFVFGGATLLVDWLAEQLVARGHEVETYGVPVHPSPDAIPAQMVGLRMWDFTGQSDMLIAVRTPSYLIKHERKVVWFIHHHRPAYDLWEAYPPVADNVDLREFRRMLFAADEAALSEARHVFSNSRRVAERLRYYNDIEAEVLYPPLGNESAFEQGSVGDALVYVSRVLPNKRQLLAVEAMASTKTSVRLVVAGKCDVRTSGVYADEIKTVIARRDLSSRVAFHDKVISDQRKIALLRDALGVVYIPEDEDSYGFVGLEAAAAHKPLVTTTDSGGVLELVTDGDGGLVVDPTADSLARAFDYLYRDRAAAKRMGERLHARAHDELDISWDHCIERLLS